MFHTHTHLARLMLSQNLWLSSKIDSCDVDGSLPLICSPRTKRIDLETTTASEAGRPHKKKPTGSTVATRVQAVLNDLEVPALAKDKEGVKKEESTLGKLQAELQRERAEHSGELCLRCQVFLC
jgi:hypothetical protein